MRESVGHDITLRLPLQTIVANCRRGLQRRLHVARLERIPSLIRIIRPDAGETVGLQFDPHLDTVCLRFAPGGTLCGLSLWQNSKQILHVMTDLVRNHISFGKFATLAAATAEPITHVTEERGIEINASVIRTVERPHGRLREAATTLNRAGVQSQPRHAVLLTAVLENFGPRVFGVPEDRGDEISHLVARLAGLLRRWRLIRLLLMSAAVHEFGSADQYARINTECPTDQPEDDDSSNTEAAAPDRNTHTAAAVTATILDVIAAAEIIPTHREFLLKASHQ